MSTARTAPRVSAIMPTRDRRPFVVQALRYFARQDYSDLELIVVDDGYSLVEDLIPSGNPRFRYLRLEQAQSVDAKRNLACEHATGVIIAHWDDDDWSAPERITRQVSALTDADVNACALTGVLHYRLLAGDAWRSTSESTPAGASMIYRRTAWEHARLDNASGGEDKAFLARLLDDECVRMDGSGLMVVVDHGRNTSGRTMASPRWQSVPLGDVASLLGDDRGFYTGLRGGVHPPLEQAHLPSAPAVNVAAAFEVFSGYGTTAEYLALSMARTGATVRAIPLGLTRAGLSAELLAMIDRASLPDDQPTVYHSWLRRDFEPPRGSGELFISTMWEANRFPSSWVPTLERARAVIVPSTFVANSCRASGVTRPVVVVPQGIDPDVYYARPRAERDGLTTLIVAPVDDRKHTRLAIAAWKKAFAGDSDARLVIKTTYGYHNYVPDDPRISYVDQVETSRGIVGYYHSADILMALGNEGFGLPLVEGMASGLPVVALNAEGQSDVCRDAGDLVLSVPPAGQELHADHIVGAAGLRSIPDADAVVRNLRWVADHRDEAVELGRKASTWAIESRNIWSYGADVLDVVGRTSARPRRMLAQRTMWVPTLHGACGVAGYAERLHRNLPSVRLVAREPVPHSDGVVHVEHEPGIMSAQQLQLFLERAHSQRARVVVTEHSVFDLPSKWEPMVSALVTTTSAGASVLRRRHPGVRVEQIPLGCETWHLPRKTVRGRTVGFFGFPGQHKGLARLAAAAARISGCEVVLYAHLDANQPVPAEITEWPTKVPLRWERSWLPIQDLAARLAAEADVLVFPYDEVSHFSASSAALIGLSTGVPVLTSDTNWFADLGLAVHRYRGGVQELSAALAELLDDDALRRRVSEAGHSHCATHSWNSVAADHVSLWNSIEPV
jgi:glycosyltransferase involved in cell wall biosynthesis